MCLLGVVQMFTMDMVRDMVGTGHGIILGGLPFSSHSDLNSSSPHGASHF